jgi:cytochrome c oxidase cbb3-type subunit I/II
MHMENPRAVIKESIMPAYPWLISSKINFKSLEKTISLFKRLGVPYSDKDVSDASISAKTQALGIAARLRDQGVKEEVSDKKIIALIAYLQALGQKGAQ